MPAVSVDGLPIAYNRAGTGPPLVLLHGLLGDGRMWKREVDGFADRYTVVAWDEPGCGRSGDPAPGAGLADHARLLEGFIDALGFERPHLLGMSWGAVLALELYHRRPDLARSMILAGAYAGWAGSLPAPAVAARLDTALTGIRERSVDAVVSAWLPTLFTDRAPLDVVNECASIMDDFHPEAAQDMLRAIAVADLRDVLPTVDVPTLLVYGRHDTRAPLPVARALLDAIPGARLAVLPDAGHLCNMESPEAFSAVVGTFLADRASAD